jgi:hypothetical protein
MDSSRDAWDDSYCDEEFTCDDLPHDKLHYSAASELDNATTETLSATMPQTPASSKVTMNQHGASHASTRPMHTTGRAATNFA